MGFNCNSLKRAPGGIVVLGSAALRSKSDTPILAAQGNNSIGFKFPNANESMGQKKDLKNK